MGLAGVGGRGRSIVMGEGVTIIDLLLLHGQLLNFFDPSRMDSGGI